MRSFVFKSLVLIAALAGASVSEYAQPFAGTSSPPPALTFAGETRVYDGKLDKFIDISVAELTLKATTSPQTNSLIIDTEAVSKGTLLKLFRYSFLQEYRSTVGLDSFRIMRTTKHDVQKDRVRDGEALFDYNERRVTYVETDPKDKTRPPRRIASEIGDSVQDMISAIYAVRLMKLSVGKKTEMTVSDSGLTYKVPLTVVAREQRSTKIGKVWTLRIEPDIFGPGKLIEQKGKMKIWVTEDPRHIPVRAEVDTQFGKIQIILRSYAKTA